MEMWCNALIWKSIRNCGGLDSECVSHKISTFALAGRDFWHLKEENTTSNVHKYEFANKQSWHPT